MQNVRILILTIIIHPILHAAWEYYTSFNCTCIYPATISLHITSLNTALKRHEIPSTLKYDFISLASLYYKYSPQINSYFLCTMSSSYSRPDKSSRHPQIPFLKNDLNIFILSTPASSKWSLSFWFSYKNHVCISLFSHAMPISSSFIWTSQ
jgi:hypothetical protein